MHELKKRLGIQTALPRPSFRRPKTGAGFTMAELTVSIAILLIIAVAIAGDINRSKYQEELSSSVRLLAGSLRDLQARALASTAPMTCDVSGIRKTCELNATGCTGVCGTTVPASAMGATLTSGASFYDRWAEVDPTLFNHRPDGAGRELIDSRPFMTGTAGTSFVTIQSLTADTGVLTTAYVTFDRQNGSMGINACDVPNAPACGGTPAPAVLDIMLRHSKTGQTRMIHIHSWIGKISIE